MSDFSFPKEARLRSKKDFGNLRHKSTRIQSAFFLGFYSISPEKIKQTRLGISVSKKLGNAVCRNRIKRLVRESFRINHTLKNLGIDLHIVAKHSEKNQLRVVPFCKLEKDFSILISKIH
ncbi:MAG: ribonuclease P protein component [Halobacteriovoraceae bacterium]|nr:ribonuclease P protein component [Halobacteriovoraceae bacterium]